MVRILTNKNALNSVLRSNGRAIVSLPRLYFGISDGKPLHSIDLKFLHAPLWTQSNWRFVGCQKHPFLGLQRQVTKGQIKVKVIFRPKLCHNLGLKNGFQSKVDGHDRWLMCFTRLKMTDHFETVHFRYYRLCHSWFFFENYLWCWWHPYE